jgi:two-component system, cell cycle response regulator
VITPNFAKNEPPRVLVVEDDPVSAALIQRLFAANNIQIDVAPHGIVALQLHRANPYRIVVSEWLMPQVDGVNLCREFRALEGPYVYFMLCTAKHQKEDRMEAYEAGVDDFLTKPLDRHELQARLKVASRFLAIEDALQGKNAELKLSSAKLEEMNYSLKRASRRFKELFDGLPVACFTFCESGLIGEWNRAAIDTFGIESQDAVGKPIWDVLSKDRTAERLWCPDRVTSLFGGQDRPIFDWEYRLGEERKVLACSVICLRDDGEPVAAICANLDITERKSAERRVEVQAELLEEMNERLSHLAITDGLTGLWNHRRFQQMLGEAIDVHSRDKEPFSLILLDIDHFKSINDELGHQVGDEVLHQIGETLRQHARSYELPARYGGEEFAIILRNCGEEQAIVAAERFRRAIEDQTWMYRPMTASLGVTTCTRPGMTPKELITQADQALYAAKERGRNRVIYWSESIDQQVSRPYLLRT